MLSVSNFASVKLPSALVNQAKDAAQPLRRSAAGQIEYWATLGRVVEHSGLTVHEARAAIEAYEKSTHVDLASELASDSLESLESLKSVKQRILAANADGSLQTHIHSIVLGNRDKADRRKAA